MPMPLRGQKRTGDEKSIKPIPPKKRIGFNVSTKGLREEVGYTPTVRCTHDGIISACAKICNIDKSHLRTGQITRKPDHVRYRRIVTIIAFILRPDLGWIELAKYYFHTNTHAGCHGMCMKAKRHFPLTLDNGVEADVNVMAARVEVLCKRSGEWRGIFTNNRDDIPRKIKDQGRYFRTDTSIVTRSSRCGKREHAMVPTSWVVWRRDRSMPHFKYHDRIILEENKNIYGIGFADMLNWPYDTPKLGFGN